MTNIIAKQKIFKRKKREKQRERLCGDGEG